MEERRISILGAGESGVGAAILAKKLGYEVFVSDYGQIADTYRSKLEAFNIEYEQGSHSFDRINRARTIVKSPGIADSVPVVQHLLDRGKEVISEIEFASRNTDATIAAITGSNGKSTTTSLLYHLLKEAGKNVGMAGNIGKSFAEMVALDAKDIYVVEVSSFQLDNIVHFRPKVAVILNITADHLDRYEYSLESYAASKFRIIANQTSDDHFIYSLDDANVTSKVESHNSEPHRYTFSVDSTVSDGAFLNNKEIIFQTNHKRDFIMQLKELSVKGTHNVYNTMAAGVAARVLGLEANEITQHLQSFRGLTHRMERVATIYGIDFINDSKATNVNSCWYALESVETPIIWIAGGVDKGNDYSILEPLVRQKVKVLIALGTENEKLLRAFGDVVPIEVETSSIRTAVAKAYKYAEENETVLLSPGCASFDLFENFEDRGNQFKQAVMSLGV